jgi:hypothetical protein
VKEGPVTDNKPDVVEVIENFYRAISGPVGNEPDPDLLGSLFVPGASVLRLRVDSREALTVEVYIALLGSALGGRNFYERGSDYRVRMDQDIAQIWSRYEASTTADFQEIIGMGTNLIQLARLEGIWRIASMIYQDDA